MATNNRLWGAERIRGELLTLDIRVAVIAIGSRRGMHVGVTRSPSGAWVTQQLGKSTAWGEGPRFLIRDNDNKLSSGRASTT